jgi:5-methylcytosine-specific restriction endonuclease McrA
MQIISRSDAKISEKKRFFTGEPCIRGHVSERYTKGGGCTKCRSNANKLHRFNNPEEFSAYQRNYVRKNKERKISYDAIRYQENKEKLADYQKKYYQENKEKCLARGVRHYQENKEKYDDYARKWRKENIDSLRVHRRNRKLRVKNAEGTHGVKDIKRILKLQKRTCAACYTKFKGDDYHVDHIVPLALGGSNWASNIQMLCPPCNMSKGAKAPEVFYAERGFLL